MPVRIVEHVGTFTQWTYDGVAHHSAIDNVDLRFANRAKFGATEVDYGLTVNNNPTVSDIYNTTPAWGFPFASSSVAVTPNAAVLIDLVASNSKWWDWARTPFGIRSCIRRSRIIAPPTELFSIFRAGTDKATDAVLHGGAPYWRLALQHVWDEGKHSAMIGTYGINVRKFPDSMTPPDQPIASATSASTLSISTSPIVIASLGSSIGSGKRRILTRLLARAAQAIHPTDYERSGARSPTITIRNMAQPWRTSARVALPMTLSTTLESP